MGKRTGGGWLLVGAALALGCGESVVSPPAANPSAKPAKAEVVIQPIKFAQFQETIQKHKGKVVVLDFWFRG
ncbi:MAG: hypothetical protein ACK4RK_15315 [Gemmataceae bacterium]